ncbi:expressed unknown protein [Seminavis robusta]|uniref:Uncharacterized protein n=1 Tax=Seminavis robusta TaxID=568900 RepID=A0A9N8DXA6_9STRA|nr:expressed unknown protein [Seminavis robusta]|eukprot:Sro363_g126950.1 n/a (1010) ;mRNA; f:57460-60489
MLINRSCCLSSTDMHEPDAKIRLRQEQQLQDKRDLPEPATCSSNDSCSSSPSSVIELFHPQKQKQHKLPVPVPVKQPTCAHVDTTKLNGIKRRARGVDSPKRAVDTKNVYVSHFTASSNSGSSSEIGSSSSASADTSSHGAGSKSSEDERKAPTSLEAFLQTLHHDPACTSAQHHVQCHASVADQAKNASNVLPPLAQPSSGTTTPKPTVMQGSQHRRQNTSDSTHSKVAAVARGASMAAQEAADDRQQPPPTQTQPLPVLDRPVACPRRQQTLGSDAFPDLLDEIIHAKPEKSVPSSTTTSNKVSPARIVRPKPPRHDKRADARATMQVMKRSVVVHKQHQNDNDNTNDCDNKHKATIENRVHLDRPVPRPVRQPTVEKPSPSSTVQPAISLTPEALLERFSQHVSNTADDDDDDDDDDNNHDARDDDDDTSLDPVTAFETPQRRPTRNYKSTTPTPHPTLHTPAINAWLNMPQQPTQQERWSNSEPILNVRQSELLLNDNSNSERTFAGEDDDENQLPTPLQVALVQQAQATSLMTYCDPSEEDDTTANDTSCDDRMFQAWLKMPPRVCTTHPGEEDSSSIPLYFTNNTTEEKWLATAAAPIQPQQQKATIATAASTPKTTTQGAMATPKNQFCARTPTSIHPDPDICLDISAIEMSMDLSLPSFFSDCRGYINDNMDTLMMQQQHTAPTPLSNRSHNNTSSVTTTTKPSNTQAELQRRMSLPPLQPHRRKPSLHVDDKDHNDNDSPIQALWASMPTMSHNSSNNSSRSTTPRPPKQQQRDLRASWPSIGGGGLLAGDDECVHVPPISRLVRHDDNECPLPSSTTTATAKTTESAVEHPTKPPQLPSPTRRRASMPPLQPHRRKPSLHLEDLDAGSSMSSSSEKSNDDYKVHNPFTAAMWASLPVISSTTITKPSSLPPAMPHRRKPSLTILEDGQEGMIEMWLSSHHKAMDRPCIAADTPPLSPGGVSLASSSASPTRIHHNHRRNDSFACESVCSIVLKEGEVEI